MRALILAAGEGTRLRPLTSERPKCLVELAGRPLLDHQLDALAAAGIEDVRLVTGYRADALEGRGSSSYHNPDFASTNMVATLMVAREALDGSDDVLVAYADIVYEPRLVEAMRDSQEDLATAIDLEWRRLWELRMEDPLADAETLCLDDSGAIRELGGRPRSLAEIQGQFLGLVRVSAAAAPRLVDFYDALGPEASFDGRSRARMYMTDLLQALVDAGWRLGAVPVEGGWLEVDSVEDLEVYRRLHRDGALDTLWHPEAKA